MNYARVYVCFWIELAFIMLLKNMFLLLCCVFDISFKDFFHL